jgi:hypothetical protein
MHKVVRLTGFSTAHGLGRTPSLALVEAGWLLEPESAVGLFAHWRLASCQLDEQTVFGALSSGLDNPASRFLGGGRQMGRQ